MARKTVDPLKAKQKKQKILLGVLGVGLLGLMAFQVPRVLKMMHPPPPPSVSGHHTATTGATPTGTPSLAAPTLSGSPPSGSTPSPTGALASSSAPLAQDGVLTSFSRFASKDPFKQQINPDKSTASSGSGGGGSARTGSTPSSPKKGRAPGPGSAVISVNGTLYNVQVGTDFPPASSTDPNATPLFHLVSLTAHTARISIVGGSYANGGSTVTLTENKPLTLMNTADGTRYKLILKPQGTSVPTSSPPSSSGASTVQLPPASPPSGSGSSTP